MKTYHTHFEVPLEIRPTGGMITNAQPNWLFLLTYDKVFLAIFHMLSSDSDSLVTTWMSSGSANNGKESLVSLHLHQLLLALCARWRACTLRPQVQTWQNCASNTTTFSVPSLVPRQAERLRSWLAMQTQKAWPCLCMNAWNAVCRSHNTTLLAFRLFWLLACLTSAKLPSFGRYSFVN